MARLRVLLPCAGSTTRSAKAARDVGIGIRNFAALLREQAEGDGGK